MTTGEILPVLEHFATPGDDAPVAAARVQPGPILFAFDMEDALRGQTFEVLMSQTNFELVSGKRQWSFIDDFYFRIYITPIELAYGTFSDDKTIFARIWNAFFSDSEFLSATPIGDSVHFDQVANLPINFRALEQREFSFTADGEGDTVLDDVFTLVFDTENELNEELIVPVSGFRAPTLTDLTWEFPPNWSAEYELEYEFKTDVITSANGREQRRQVRQTPRKTQRFNVGLLSNTQRLDYRRLLTGNQSGRFFVPEYTRRVRTTSVIPAQGIEVDVDEVPPWWLSTHDAYVVLNYRDQWSLRRVDFIGSDSNSQSQRVFFKTDDDLEWPVGTKIHPALSSWMADDIGGNLLTNTIQTAAMAFLCLPGSEAIEPESLPIQTFDGRELWLEKPNWADPPQVTDYHPTTFIDFGYGRVDRIKEIAHQGTRLVLSYTGRDFEQSELLRKFFFRCAGQCREFYMPTWQYDIELRDPIGLLDTQLIVAGLDLAAFYSGDPVRYGAGIAIVKLDGTISYFSIQDIFAAEDSNSEAVSVIELTSAAGEIIALEDIEKICWVPLWRHVTDTMTVQWLSDEVCRIAFTVQTQPWLPEDIDDSNSDFDSNSQSASGSA